METCAETLNRFEALRARLAAGETLTVAEISELLNVLLNGNRGSDYNAGG